MSTLHRLISTQGGSTLKIQHQRFPVVWLDIKENYYFKGEFPQGGGQKSWLRILKNMQNASKHMAKIEKRVKNIQFKTSEVLYLNKCCSDCIQKCQNQLLGPIYTPNQVRVFNFIPAPSLSALTVKICCARMNTKIIRSASWYGMLII
jgi:hypothetical protein